MKSTRRKALLAFAAQLPPDRGRSVVRAIAAKDAEDAEAGDFDAALERMAEAVEARMALELEELFAD